MDYTNETHARPIEFEGETYVVEVLTDPTGLSLTAHNLDTNNRMTIDLDWVEAIPVIKELWANEPIAIVGGDTYKETE